MTALHDLGTQLEPPDVVQIQHVDGSTADLCETTDAHTIQGEVLRPAITARMKKPGDLQRLNINSGRTLTKLPRWHARARLSGAMKCLPQFAVFLPQLTVFPPLVSAPPYQVARCRAHL